MKGRWDEADEILALLTKGPNNIEVIDHADGSTTVRDKSDDKVISEAIVQWTEMRLDETIDDESSMRTFVSTVDVESYRERLRKTMEHLEASNIFQNATPVSLLSLSEENIPARKIVWEGWVQVLLPKILAELPSSRPYVLVVEDDARVFKWAVPILPSLNSRLASVFSQNPDVDIISLGHSGAGAGPFHSLAALALRTASLSKIHSALSEIPRSKRTHLDLFLFNSPKHSLGIGRSIPPVFGWAESELTLTAAASGQRRKGGGRLAAQEPKEEELRWTMRKVVDS